MNSANTSVPQQTSSWGAPLWATLSFLALTGVCMVISGLAYRMFGQPFLDLMALQHTSSLMLFAAGAFGVFFMCVMVADFDGDLLGKSFSSIWIPIKVVMLASLLVPAIPGPASESISLLSYMILALFS